MAFLIFFTFSGEISFVLPLMYLDTVDFETPAYAATSLMVTFVCFFSFIQKLPRSIFSFVSKPISNKLKKSIPQVKLYQKIFFMNMKKKSFYTNKESDFKLTVDAALFFL